MSKFLKVKNFDSNQKSHNSQYHFLRRLNIPTGGEGYNIIPDNFEFHLAMFYITKLTNKFNNNHWPTLIGDYCFFVRISLFVRINLCVPSPNNCNSVDITLIMGDKILSLIPNFHTQSQIGLFEAWKFLWLRLVGMMVVIVVSFESFRKILDYEVVPK